MLYHCTITVFPLSICRFKTNIRDALKDIKLLKGVLVKKKHFFCHHLPNNEDGNKVGTFTNTKNTI